MSDEQVASMVEDFARGAALSGDVLPSAAMWLHANILFALSHLRGGGSAFDGTFPLRLMGDAQARATVQSACDRMLADWRARHPT
jgi:hypothetical protein